MCFREGGVLGVFSLDNHVCKNEKLYFFPFQSLCLLFFPMPISLARSSGTMLNGSYMSGYACLIPISCRENIQSCTTKNDGRCRFF